MPVTYLECDNIINYHTVEMELNTVKSRHDTVCTYVRTFVRLPVPHTRKKRLDLDTSLLADMYVEMEVYL